jgi:hypothetical protein
MMLSWVGFTRVFIDGTSLAVDIIRSDFKNVFWLPASAGLVARFKSSKYSRFPPVLALKRRKTDGESRAAGKNAAPPRTLSA